MHELTRTVANFAVAVAWQSGVVACLALVAMPLLRFLTPRGRHALLVLALVASALVPYGWISRRASKDLVRVFDASVSTPITIAHTAKTETVLVASPLSKDVVAGIIAAVYLLACMWSAATLLIALRRTSRLRRTAVEDPLTRPSATLSPLTRGEGQIWRSADEGLFDVPVRFSAHVNAPVTIGALRPMILLPASGIPDDMLVPVLAHELAHVRRRDALIQLLLEILSLPVTCHPLVRMLKRRMAVAREMACDALVTSSLVEPRHYARVLLSLAQRTSLPRTALALGHADALEARLRWLRDFARTPVRKRSAILAAVAVTSLLLAAVMFSTQLRVNLFGATRPSDFSGQWQLDVNSADYGPIPPYEAFTQTLRASEESWSVTQQRVRRGRVQKRSWSITTDGVRRPFPRNSKDTVASARWEDGALRVEVLSTIDGHRQTSRLWLADANTLVVEGHLNERRAVGPFRYVFHRRNG